MKKILLESQYFDEGIVSSVMTAGLKDTLAAILKDASLDSGKEVALNRVMISLIAIGLNLTGMYVLRKSLTNDATNIYRNIGLLFGITYGIFMYYGRKDKGVRSNSLGTTIADKLGYKFDKDNTKDIIIKESWKILDFLFSATGKKIISKLIKPFMKPAFILMRPFYKLPQYSEAWESVKVDAGANKDGFTSFVLAFGSAAFGSFAVCALLNKSKGQLESIDLTKDKIEELNKSKIKETFLESIQGISDISTVAELTPQVKINKSIGAKYYRYFFNLRIKKSEASFKHAKGLCPNKVSFKNFTDDSNVHVSYDNSKVVQLHTKAKELQSQLNIKDVDLYTDERSKNDRSFILKCIIKGLNAYSIASKSKIKTRIQKVNIVVGKFENVPSGGVEYISLWNASMNILTGELTLMFENVSNQNKMVTESEISAIILHEIGHFETTQSVMVHIGLMGKVASLIAMPIASGFYKQLINGSFAMYMNAIGRYVEIQADKFATARGYGSELVSGLAKLSGSKINPNQKYDNNEVHSDVNLRMNTILKYAPLYDKINKQAMKD